VTSPSPKQVDRHELAERIVKLLRNHQSHVSEACVCGVDRWYSHGLVHFDHLVELVERELSTGVSGDR
jgi:hypothetical protein